MPTPLWKDAGEGSPWQLIRTESSKDLGERQRTVSQGGCAKPRRFYIVSCGSSRCCALWEGGPFLIDHLLQNCYNRSGDWVFTELLRRSIQRCTDYSLFFFFLIWWLGRFILLKVTKMSIAKNQSIITARSCWSIINYLLLFCSEQSKSKVTQYLKQIY